MIKDKAFWVFIGIISLVAIFCISLAVIFRDDLNFDAAEAINDGIRFIIGLLSMIISFWIAEIYWKRKIEGEQTKQAINQLDYYFSQISRITSETTKALAEQFGEGKADDSDQRDREVLANLRRLGDARTNTLRIVEVSNIELNRNLRASKICSYFRSTIAPILDELSKRKQIRPGVNEIEDDLAKIGNDIKNLVSYMRGEYDEHNPPWESY